MKITPWVDIVCCRCGWIANGSGYYYRGIIKALHQNTKDWHEIRGDVYCPDCYAKLKDEQT